MVVRPKLHWFLMLFVLRGSVLPLIAPRLLGTSLFAALVTWLHSRYAWLGGLNFISFSLIGLSLAIFLGFRNSTAYERYWEARTLWGSLLNASRTLTRQALTISRAPEAAHSLALRLSAFVHVLRHQLRGTSASADLALFLPPAECQRIEQARFPASVALLLADEWLRERLQAGDVSEPVIPAFEQELAQLGSALGGCERIAANPVPFTYAVIIHRCVYLYCFLLPFGLVDSIGVMTPLVVCFVAYTFFSLEALSAEIEDPFGTEPNDLALEAMSHMIESSLLELVGEAPRTAKPEVKDYVLL